MTGRQLVAWRLAQRDPVTGRPMTQREAGLWYGLADSSADEADTILDGKAAEARLDNDEVAYYHFDEVPA